MTRFVAVIVDGFIQIVPVTADWEIKQCLDKPGSYLIGVFSSSDAANRAAMQFYRKDK